MSFHQNSEELMMTVMFSAVLSIAEVLIYNLSWPLFPPITVMPFVTSFLLAVSISFTEKQWVMGLIAALIAIASKGGILPGLFIIPLYGILFQSRRIKAAGAVAPIIHVVYGVFLAPLLFVVAPALVIQDLILRFVNHLAFAVIVAAAIFGTMGAIGATIGYHTGLKIAKSIPHLSFHTNLNNQS